MVFARDNTESPAYRFHYDLLPQVLQHPVQPVGKRGQANNTSGKEDRQFSFSLYPGLH